MSNLPPPAGNHGAHIVVADANVETRDYVVRLFGEGWRIEAVSDGPQAFDAVRRELPDLVLADVMLCGSDGISLLAALRAEPARAVPVILLSARAGEEARLQALEAGADDYLAKPFAARELMARVEGILTLNRVRREAQAALRASEERYRAFIELTSDAVWRIEVEEPVPPLPADEQIERFYRHTYLAECNDAMAHMYGYGAAAELVGARLGDLLPQSDPAISNTSAPSSRAATASPKPRPTRSAATAGPAISSTTCSGSSRMGGWCAPGARSVTSPSGASRSSASSRRSGWNRSASWPAGSRTR